MATAERVSFQANGHLQMKQFRASEMKAIQAIGMLIFLIVDQGTSSELRAEAESKIPFLENLAREARSEWLKRRSEPRMQGRKGPPDPELDEIIEDLILTVQGVNKEFTG